MAGKFKVGDRAFIVESNRFIREVEVRSCAGGMYLVRFLDSVGGNQTAGEPALCFQGRSRRKHQGKEKQCCGASGAV